MGPYSNMIAIVRRQSNEDRDTREAHEERDWSMQLQVKEPQRLLTNHQKLERGKEDIPYHFQREHGTAGTLCSGI